MSSLKSLRQAGFTLIELLVVIAIIALLMAGGLVAFTGAQKNARDGRRISDVRATSQAFEQYRTTNGAYPTYAVAAAMSTTAPTLTGGNALYFPTGTFPADPKNVAPYQYAYSLDTTGTTGFCICAALETQKGNATKLTASTNACDYTAGVLPAGVSGYFCLQNQQ